MGTTPTDTQILNQLSRILDHTREIQARADTTRLLQILDVLRGQVSRLSREHESIRGDLRDLRNALNTSN